MNSTFLGLLLTLLTTDAPAAGPTRPTISFNICCLRNTQGVVHASLYNSADTWLKAGQDPVRHEMLALKGSKLRVVFQDLPPGRYAGSVLHDENSNNKMDMNWFPIPRPAEGAGVTHNAEGKFGPPSYDSAAFVLADQPLTFNVLMRY